MIRWALCVAMLAGCGGKVSESGDRGNGHLQGAGEDDSGTPSQVDTAVATADTSGDDLGIICDCPSFLDTAVDTAVDDAASVEASEFSDLPPCAERPLTCDGAPTDAARDTLSSQAAMCKAGIGMSGGDVPVDWCGSIHATFDDQGCLTRVSGSLDHDQLACMFQPWLTAKKRWMCFAGTTVTVTGKCP